MKKRIVIASVLKPLNDTRMTEKIASTLAENPSHEIHVIGFPSSIPSDSRITFHTFPSFKRLSAARWLASFRILRMILRIKPTIIIVTTHELLMAGVASKILLRSKLVYDVQENYNLNIRHTEAFPAFVRFVIAAWVRMKEQLLSRFVNHFFLAEKVYAQQLTFIRNRFTILENKALKSDHSNAEPKARQLVFTGTLSRSTGVFRAIELVKKLHEVEPSITLTIIGFAAIDSERKQLQSEAANATFIRLIGADRLVDHSEIMEAIRTAGAGVIAYEPSPATEGRVPTKMFEYLSYGLPLIFLDSQPESAPLATLSQTSIVQVDSKKPDINSIVQWIYSNPMRGTSTDAFLWKSEESKLLTAISAL